MSDDLQAVDTNAIYRQYRNLLPDDGVPIWLSMTAFPGQANSQVKEREFSASFRYWNDDVDATASQPGS
ncbi:MAG: hypothetical protein ABI076_12095 [Acidobacteriaceae bacterium]